MNKMEDTQKQLLEDLLVTALEGGSNYWYELDEKEFDNLPLPGEPKAIRLYEALMNGDEFTVYEQEHETPFHKLALQDMLQGLKLLEEKYPEHYGNLYTGQWDAETADVWFQLTVLKEVIYG